MHFHFCSIPTLDDKARLKQNKTKQNFNQRFVKRVNYLQGTRCYNERLWFKLPFLRLWSLHLFRVRSALHRDSGVNLEWMCFVISGLCNEILMQYISLFFCRGLPLDLDVATFDITKNLKLVINVCISFPKNGYEF